MSRWTGGFCLRCVVLGCGAATSGIAGIAYRQWVMLGVKHLAADMPLICWVVASAMFGIVFDLEDVGIC